MTTLWLRWKWLQVYLTVCQKLETVLAIIQTSAPYYSGKKHRNVCSHTLYQAVVVNYNLFLPNVGPLFLWGPWAAAHVAYT